MGFLFMETALYACEMCLKEFTIQFNKNERYPDFCPGLLLLQVGFQNVDTSLYTKVPRFLDKANNCGGLSYVNISLCTDVSRIFSHSWFSLYVKKYSHFKHPNS